MKQIEVFKRDNALVEFLAQHKGKGNYATTQEISDYLNSKGYAQKKGSINMLIRKVMFERHLPICSINSTGYYWGTTKQELLETVEDLRGRIQEMQNRIELLESFIID